MKGASMFHRSQRFARTRPQPSLPGALNLVPFLDVLMNLILFLLISQGLVASLGAIRAGAARPPAPGPAPGVTDLRLALTVSDAGYLLVARGGVSPARTGAFQLTRAEGGERPLGPSSQVVLPRRAD